MSALADNKERYSKAGNIVAMPCGVDIIYRGAYVMLNAAGFIVAAATGAGQIGAGVAMEKIDNSAGSAGDLSVRVELADHHIMDGFSGLTQASVGKDVFATTDNDFTLTTGNNIPVGKIVEFISATEAVVRLVYGGVSV